MRGFSFWVHWRCMDFSRSFCRRIVGVKKGNDLENNNLLSVLTREGVLIKVSVRYWRGCKKLKAEDIGLKQADVSDRLISLGHKRLLPKDTLAQLSLIEGRAHALVEANTFPFL